ncbi:LysM domain protein [compost metagenome]
MNRAFVPGGPGFRRPFRPFPHPFFPGRFLFPFFFFSPFLFPFFREEDSRNDAIFAHHQTQPGDTLDTISHMYNIPASILEEANPHITNPNQIQPGANVYIPRISHMYCHKTYMEHAAEVQPNGQPNQAMPFMGSQHHM